MHYVLSDFGKTIDFFPLCLSRPLSELRFGVHTIADQWRGLIPEGFFCYDTLPHLAPWYPPLSVEKEHVLLNGSIFPTQAIAAAVLRLATDEVLVQGDIEIARRTQPKPQEVKRIVFEDHPVVELAQPSDLFSKLDLVLSEAIQAHIQHQKSEALHPSCCVIGKHPVFMDEGAVAYAATFNTENGPIYIGKNALVMEGSLIRGPFVLGDSGVVKMGAKIYGPTVIGPYSKVGGELNNVVIHSYSNKGHDGYLGNAVIGQWCNLGANTTNSNLKNTFEEVRLYRYSSRRFEPTGLQFCGLIMGDHSKTAIGTVLNTGTVIGYSTNVFSSGFPRNFIPSFKWGGAQGLSEYRLDKAKRTAEEMMKRRNVSFAPQEDALFDTLHELIPQWE